MDGCGLVGEQTAPCQGDQPCRCAWKVHACGGMALSTHLTAPLAQTGAASVLLGPSLSPCPQTHLQQHSTAQRSMAVLVCRQQHACTQMHQILDGNTPFTRMPSRSAAVAAIPAASLSTNCGCASLTVEAITTSSLRLLYREQKGLQEPETAHANSLKPSHSQPQWL